MVRIPALAALAVALTLTPATPAAASPADPYGEDWVAIAVAPAVGGGGYGADGTQEGAARIAMDECAKHGNGSRCVVASVIEYGCVAFVLDKQQRWAGGRGPDADAAVYDAEAKMPADSDLVSVTGGNACSTPVTPP